MPKPQGTYLKIQQHDKAQQSAKDDKITAKNAQERDLAKFYKALDRVSESQLKSWQRDMADLSNRLKKDGAMAEDDKTRKKVSEVLKEVRKILEQVKDYRQLEASLQQPAKEVIKARSQPAGPDLLIVVIALFHVLEVLVRTANRKK